MQAITEQIASYAEEKELTLFEAIIEMVDNGVVPDIEEIIEQLDDTFKERLKDDILSTQRIRPSLIAEAIESRGIDQFFS